MLDPELSLRLKKLQDRREELLTVSTNRALLSADECVRIARELAAVCQELTENFEVLYALRNLINERYDKLNTVRIG